jgi:soluble cytochrome b562
MPFTPKTDWADAPSVTTPITAAELIRMENGIAEGARDGTESQRGNLELATAGEMTAGTDTARVPSVKRVYDHVSSVVGALSFASQAYVQAAIAAPRTILSTAATMVPLTLKGFTGQSEPLLEFRSSSDELIGKVDQAGQFTSGATFTGTAQLKAKCRGISIPGLRVQGYTGQTGNLIIAEDSGGVTKMSVGPDGTVNGPNVGTIPGSSPAIKYSPVLILDATATVPTGTLAGTVILRRPAA